MLILIYLVKSLLNKAGFLLETQDEDGNPNPQRPLNSQIKGTSMKSLPRTKAQLQKIIRDELQSILLSNITADALENPQDLDYNDIVDNLHLYDRLYTAQGALCALKGYFPSDHTFTLIEDPEPATNQN